MQELIGACVECEKPVYCKEGFLDGVLIENHRVLCFPCNDRRAAAAPTAKEGLHDRAKETP
ncbi:hypothetical protein [Paenibacillus sp.]|uniref:hypothetical protein n=1 Tax=Paenibacillus sp. TaxID=58172 RepID=UPI002D72021A|nr:hypothetical protein [Paenibacillus sp.]HZG87949.1 hypothetical protein [Paenibacillus sp.]